MDETKHSDLQQADVLRDTAEHIRQVLAGDSSGHDWWHIERVRQLALHIGRHEGADLFVVELGALLHDIADWKFHQGDSSVGPRRAAEWLVGLCVDAETVDHVREIVDRVSYKGSGVATPMHSLEGRVVQDADRLDAIGAIGIARTFAYGGHAGRAIYDPTRPPEQHDSFAAYQRSTGPTINHFYEKLLLLKDRMQTPTGRAMAAGRHAFMEQFLARFFSEWNAQA
ncbi:MAG: HD domain-containing protein [Pirellulales bacterium]